MSSGAGENCSGVTSFDRQYHMAELLRRQSSMYESNHPKCMWGLLQFFNCHQRLQARNMLAYRSRGNGRQAGRAKIPKSKLSASSIVKEHDFLDSEANHLMEDKVNATKRSSSEAPMRSLISKLYKKQDGKQKILPLASQLLRTISIHHLECNDYVIPDEMTSDSETSTVKLNSHETDSSASTEYVALWPRGPDGPVSGQRCPADYVGHNQLDEQSLNTQAFLLEKLNKAKDSLLKQKGADARELGRDVALQSEFLDMFDANRELYLRILEDPKSIMEDYIQPLQDSSSERVLTKSRSFPGAGLSGRRNGELSKLKWKRSGSFVNQEKSQAANSPSVSNTIKDDSKGAASIAGGKLNIRKSRPEILDSAETCSSFEFLAGSPCKLKKQGDRGTVLNRFKVLKQRIKDVIRENRMEHRRISLDGFLHKIPYGHKAPEDVEKEKLRLQDGPASDRCKLGSGRYVSANNNYNCKNIQRSLSLTESLERYSRLIETISLREFKRPPERLNSNQEQNRKSPKTWGRIFSNPEFASYDFNKDVPSELSDAPVSSKIPASGLLAVDTFGSDEPKSVSTLVHAEDSMESDIYVEHSVTDIEQLVLTNEREQSEPYKFSDDLSAEESSHVPLDEAARIEVESHDRTTGSSPISVLNSYFQEDPVNPMMYSVSEGSELKPGWITFEEPDSVANDVSDGVEIVQADLNTALMPIDLTDFNAISIQVDQKDEAEFNYVRDILKISRFNGEDFVEAWYSPYQPVDLLLFGEADGAHHELNIARDKSDGLSVDQQLLFDLVNEVLLDIFESSLSHGPGLSRFGSHFRPKPVGNHVLEEVWEKISWHLSFQRHLNRTLDYIVARDFAKNDGWMILLWDADCVGIELGFLILDDLLDEVILDFGDLSQCVAF